MIVKDINTISRYIYILVILNNIMKKTQEEEIEEILKIPSQEIITKETKVQFNGRQYEIRIPMLLIGELNIKKGDIVIIEYNTRTKEYSIKFKKNAKTKKKTKKKN